MRRSFAAAVATFGLAGSSWLSPAGGASAGDTGVAVRSAVSATPAIEVRGADGTDRAALADALFRFASAGLQLPDLTVVFSDDESDCAGHMGAFDQRGEPWRVSVCSELAFVIPHELAHAWAAANLDDVDRARYLEARGLTNWSDRSRPWGERGTEDAAFIVQQNLRDVAPRTTVSPTWTERIAAFELLTGSVSPLRIWCPRLIGPFGHWGDGFTRCDP